MVLKAQYPMSWSLERAKNRYNDEGVKNIWSLLTM